MERTGKSGPPFTTTLGCMKIEPFAALGEITFGSDQATVVARLGEPQRTSTSRTGEFELHYPRIVVRLAKGRVVEATADSKAIQLGGAEVPFQTLSAFVRAQDQGVFERTGFVVSPKYGIAFDPAFPCWVTAFPRERLASWQNAAQHT